MKLHQISTELNDMYKFYYCIMKTEKKIIQTLNHQTSSELKSITINIAEVLHLNWAQVTVWGQNWLR